MTTCPDDCDPDTAKPLRALVWKVVRTQLAAKDPVHMQKFFGVVREACDSTSSCRGLRLTQSDNTAKILEDAVKLGLGPIFCATAGQSVTPLDPKLLPEQPCVPGVRELVGSLSRCTRFDLSFVIARLARFVTRWCEWDRHEISHILVFVAHSAGLSPIMKSADDDCKKLKLSTLCDASVGRRCVGGYKVKLTGSRGSSFLIECASRLQGPQSTSSTESESIECGLAAKAMLRVKGALDACRLKPVPCDGYVDNDALRMAVCRGSSVEARASPRPRIHLFSFPGAASNFAASGEYDRRRGFLVLVLNRTAAEQTDLCEKVRTMFLLTTGSEMFSKSSSPVVRRGGAREL